MPFGPWFAARIGVGSSALLIGSGAGRRPSRARLQSPDRLIDLGMHMMADAESRLYRSPLQQALTYRDGLIIAFLAYRPVRASRALGLLGAAKLNYSAL